MPARTKCFTILSAPCLVRANTSVRVNAVFCKKVREQVRLVPRLDEVHRLLDQLGRRGDRADLHVRRIAQPLAGQLANLGRHRGREHQRLPCLRHRRHDPPQRNDEAHVEHLVGLVENQDLDVAQVDVALLHQVEQPAGRGDEDIDAVLQRPHLRTLADAAVDDGVSQAGELAVGRRSSRQFGRPARASARESATGSAADRRAETNRDACRCACRSARRAFPLAAAVWLTLVLKPLQRGQRERGRLAGARLGAAHQVAPGEHGRNGLKLDRRGRVVALVAHGAEQRIGQAKIDQTSSHEYLSFQQRDLSRRAGDRSRRGRLPQRAIREWLNR